MRVEIYYRTYSSFGSNVTLDLAGKWLTDHLKPDYGGGIRALLIELCCGNVSPPRKTLEGLDENFQAFLKTLPAYLQGEDNTELRICYRAVKYYHDEITRDTQTIGLKLFSSVLTKSASLVQATRIKSNEFDGFDSDGCANDIVAAKEIAPATLQDLAQLYLNTRVGRAT